MVLVSSISATVNKDLATQNFWSLRKSSTEQGKAMFYFPLRNYSKWKHEHCSALDLTQIKIHRDERENLSRFGSDHKKRS